MTKTYSQIQRQIEQLSREAEKLRGKEVEGVVSRIKEAIATYGLSAADLGFGEQQRTPRRNVAAKKSGGRKKAAAKSQTAQAKYRDESGNTWGGRGPRPQWLRDALASGKDLKEFAV